jgi:hypothetical protein
MHGWRPYHDVHRERIRAHRKHDGTGDSMERKDWRNYATWVTVLLEEVSEVAKVFCDHRHLGELSDREELKKELREELVQVAAMTCAWIDAIDRDLG